MENDLSSLLIDDTLYETKLTKKFLQRKKYSADNNLKIKAVIPGIIRHIFVSNNSIVKKGDKLLILEAMKMQNVIISPANGKIKSVNVAVGQIVVKGSILIDFE